MALSVHNGKRRSDVSQENYRKLTRRQFVHGTSLLAAGGVLAACAPKVSPAPAEPATPTAPAAVATPAPATPVPKEPVTLVQMNWGTAARHQKRDAALRQVFPQLEMMPVEFEVVESTPETLRLRLAAGTGIPDMIRFNVPHYAEFAHANQLLDVSELFPPVADDLFGGAKEICSVEGRYIAFPCMIKSKIFWYRADLFEEAGVDVASIVSLGDFVNAGKALNAKFPKSYIINLAGEPNMYWSHLVLSAYSEARIADPDGTFVFDTLQPFKDYFALMKELLDSGIAFPTDDWSPDWQQAFADSSICGSLLANWMTLFIPGFAPQQGGKWKGALWPTLQPYRDQRYGSEAGGAVYSVPRQCPHPLEATEYLRMNWLTPEGWTASFESEGLVPLMKSVVAKAVEASRNPKRPDGMSDEAWAAHPSNYFGPEALEIELQSYDLVRVFPYDPSNLKEFTILRDWLIKFLANDIGLDEALRRAREDMEGQIGNPYDI
jgi:ABC-type glycerol-3-phosphate transport system substrate-binding protein